nr:immunoglobulin heavy chain junction region [Macaca mulatta]MOW80084.1 immunoglobulin heavy chain junction region [Macaca mulatta]MOW80148.1 immunoglobulin heavy chain junction region [Macaca mulatta]MOW82332.1 immunoglobulin heavy chain junction region [Macaca mulatta]MOW82613.1 immunoglobulin heavy chain junction region [Macaca mulatta]
CARGRGVYLPYFDYW